ncbi:preferentially expressed antigen in melanoma-like protein 7 [Peromyscus eremicus]|uniref:preferentially expressed antigen in melanoma-like protein 7 n=1 Tax=Peromyscus eremicus TaxID=42410 RepID=UPI0027DE47BE|nr:preferentially expressed antigen in melanoma-like protein 7 [Peromyscus eremicus]
MSLQARPTLLQLAGQSLVINETLDISTLQDQPMEFFPILLKEANTQRKTEMIKALVADWPYLCLSVGLLMKNPDLEIYQTMLDGVGTWLKRESPPGGQKLLVVDLRNVHHDVRGVWSGRDGGNHSTESLPEKLLMKRLLPQRTLRRQCVKVVIDLHLTADEYQKQLLKWAENIEGSLKLCCVRLRIGTEKGSTVRNVFKILQLKFINELELNTVGNLSTLASFVPFIRKMRNLEKILLVRVFQDHTHAPATGSTTDRDEKYVRKIISQFSKLNCLKHVTIDDVYFLNDHMKQLLRCLKTPLESLSISLCNFSQSDLESFAQWGHCQLKHLYLRGVNLSDLNFMPLKVFLQSVADTLLTLELEDCRMKDPDLRVLLPALSQCSLLTSINLYDNEISINALKDLLYHTADLSQLNKELYPAPKEVYDHSGYIKVVEFSQCCAELKSTFANVRQLRSVCFGSNPCLDCCERYFYKLETTLCDCSL